MYLKYNMELESQIEYKISENIEHVKYSNLYYIDNSFCYLSIDSPSQNKINLKKIKTIAGPEHTGRQDPNNYFMIPKKITFESSEKLQTFIDTLNIRNIKGKTLYFSHYYEHNIAHSLWDVLYPIYLAYLNFYNTIDNEQINMFVNLLFDRYWKSPSNYVATRDWVLNVFKDFCCNGQFIIKNTTNYNMKFDYFIVGADRAGISSTNKLGVMPGNNLNVLDKLRNRFFKVYNIVKQKRDNINLLFINSERYTFQEKQILKQLIDYYKSKKYSVKFIDWKDITSFKEQLEIMNETDIQVSGAGSCMLNFPFMNNNSININLGVKNYNPNNIPSLLETNICLLSNEIYSDFYDIYKYKELKYNPLKEILDNNIYSIINNNVSHTKVPYYIQKWRELCNEKNMGEIIDMMNCEIGCKNTLIHVRFPDIWMQLN